MEKCKFCQAELAENGTFCPNCGRNNAEEEMPAEETVLEAAVLEETVQEVPVAEEPAAEEAPAEKKKATPGKIALAIAAVVVLAAALIALVVTGAKNNQAEDGTIAAEPTAAVEETVAATIPADGNPDDVTCKGTYTVTDDVAIAEKDVVVATMGEHVLTNAQLRIYYRSAISSFLNTEYGYYMMMYGALDYTKPLDTQLSTEGEMTWQQFFVKSALDNWRLVQSMALEAKAAGIEMRQEDREYLDGLRASLEDMAAEHSLNVEDMLKSDFGAGVNYEDFLAYQQLYMQGNPYYTEKTQNLVATEDVLKAYFQENEETYAAAGVTMDSKFVDVRHILVQVKGGFLDTQGNTKHSDKEWAECEAAAQEILDQWLAGEKTEESFAALASEKTEDPGSMGTGGLYEDVYPGQMVEPFDTWCFDESRQYGDYDLVKTSYGYHVMFYVGSEPMWKQYAQTDWTNDQINQLLDSIMEDHPIEVTYENISLGEVAMA